MHRFGFVFLWICALAVASPSGAGALAWDGTQKEHRATPGETKAEFAFTVHNASAAPITVTGVRTSCGCTVAGFPHLPWTIAAGTSSDLKATVDFHGKWGLVEKQIFVATSAGVSTLTVKVDAGERPKLDAAPLLARARNIQVASADRQAVFTNRACAECHAKPLAGKRGAPLYDAACGICHDSPHRATMVPDLRALPAMPDRATLRQLIARGRSDSLMPGFARAVGGPLSDEQIESIVEYLSRRLRPARRGAAVVPKFGADPSS